MSSLSARLLLSVSLLLLVFFGATIAVLDIAFRQAGEQAQRHILDGHLMSLLAAAEPDADNELRLPPDLPEPRFGNPQSGLYGELRDAQGRVVWQSRSALGLDLPYPRPPGQGSNHYAEIALEGGAELAAVSLAVDWELPNGDSDRYTFSVAESLDTYYAQLGAFRRQLFGWFTAVALVMLFSISLAMRGVLRPLRQIEQEIGEIEDGRRQTLSENFPSELSGVAANMNMLIGSERARSERYRNTLDNLAHSLKTPLAAIRSVIAEHPGSELAGRVEAQVERMNDIVRYQLRKPASRVVQRFGMTAVDVEKELRRLVESLAKVYKDKNPSIELEVADGVAFRGDRGDFLELAGNLLDNACKWCRSRVALSVRPLESDGAGLELIVSDDGAGIPPEVADVLLERGTRLDESAPGHGIGLAVVNDIAASYGGDVRIGRSEAGGAEVTVTLAAA
jgi:two-component system, OmpR family, sensor histidine kinase PhoQ